jgi:(p)ppGpp synthase/HD superfamily hydrolase
MLELYMEELMNGLDIHEPSKDDLLQMLFSELQGTPFNSNQIALIRSAYSLAYNVHRTTPYRVGGEAYIFHPVRSAVRLIRLQKKIGFFDHQVIALILVHDIVEELQKCQNSCKTADLYPDFERILGTSVASDLQTITKRQREKDQSYNARLLRSQSWRLHCAKCFERGDNIWTLDAFLLANVSTRAGESPSQKVTRKLIETEIWYPSFKAQALRLINPDQELLRSFIRGAYEELFETLHAVSLVLKQ